MGEFINTLMAGEITFLTSIVWCIVAMICGAIGGAIGGIVIGGEHLGNDLAAMMGAFFGPMAAVPGILAALILFSLFC